MGRIAGVSPAETRARLLRAAAAVFAERGYEGTRVAEIAAVAGVSRGALYAHFASKAELLLAALRAHAPKLPPLAPGPGEQLGEQLGEQPGEQSAGPPPEPLADLLVAAGARLPHRRPADDELIVEALVTARRDDEVADAVREWAGERTTRLAGMVRAAQDGGEVDDAVSPLALAHLCFLLAAGSALVTPDVSAVGDAEWTALLRRLVNAIAPDGTTTSKGEPL
ncbi:TetR/AcrR family transcriptional regulator [Spongiactinospora sp. TRM90649]|uniref:TetR/AcrR family transcriptional regulator n=1 Tax=Spongiactinospora sp. TRM90649 TaxID=3031114 RepID=UPI0023F6B63F|nr:TetR/AcrR family transcriptional regulator [Spongiactinospora sp. TRM90649]MDF5754270.1 helix-turn-helix domain containing protein [Spongiactinospora sp. TRM90649]